MSMQYWTYGVGFNNQYAAITCLLYPGVALYYDRCPHGQIFRVYTVHPKTYLRFVCDEDKDSFMDDLLRWRLFNNQGGLLIGHVFNNPRLESMRNSLFSVVTKPTGGQDQD